MLILQIGQLMDVKLFKVPMFFCAFGAGVDNFISSCNGFSNDWFEDELFFLVESFIHIFADNHLMKGMFLLVINFEIISEVFQKNGKEFKLIFFLLIFDQLFAL